VSIFRRQVVLSSPLGFWQNKKPFFIRNDFLGSGNELTGFSTPYSLLLMETITIESSRLSLAAAAMRLLKSFSQEGCVHDRSF
jgi:hypothetical protein